jgi:predicted Zn finger-like uncharacterized protein
LIVECDRCRAKYHYDDERFAGKPSKKLRCSKCQAIFEVFNTPSFEAQPPVRPPITSGETMLRKDRGGPRGATAPQNRVSTTGRAKSAALQLPGGRRLSLAVIAGPDAGKMFVIEKPRVVIGREDVDLALDDTELSRQHAAIEVHGDDILLIDLGSTNGTLVGETPVTEAPLENQGEFTVGGSTLMLIVTPES